MQGEVINRSNPPPPPSQLPDSIKSLLVRIEKATLNEDVNDALSKFRRVANYIAAGT